MTTPICRILTIITCFGLLAACAPPPTAPTSNNLTLEMRRLNSAFNVQEQTVQKLSSQVMELESRLQRQSEEIQQLRQTPQQEQTAQQPLQRPQATTASIQEEG